MALCPSGRGAENYSYHPLSLSLLLLVLGELSRSAGQLFGLDAASPREASHQGSVPIRGFASAQTAPALSAGRAHTLGAGHGLGPPACAPSPWSPWGLLRRGPFSLGSRRRNNSQGSGRHGELPLPPALGLGVACVFLSGSFVLLALSPPFVFSLLYLYFSIN